MHILQLCKKFPVPLNDGESIAVTNLSRGMNEHGLQLTLLSMNTTRHPVDLKAVKGELDHYENVYSVNIDNRIKVKDAFLNLFSRKSFHIDRFDVPEFREMLRTVLSQKRFDIIQLETPFLSPYIPSIRSATNAPVVMRAHNVEHEIWESICLHMSAGPKRWYLNYLTSKLRMYEIEMLQQYDAILAITQRDMDTFRSLGYRGQGLVVPIGLNPENYQAEKAENSGDELTMSFIGSLDWLPNTEGLHWFIREVWPALREQYSGISFHIAGRNAPADFAETLPGGVFYHGEVDDATAFIRAYDIMLVPLKSGSGMRAKILEGMALAKAIISTRIGAEGIGAQHKDTIMLADTREELLDSVGWCLEEKKKLGEIGLRARNYVEQNFHYNFVAGKIADFYRDILKEKNYYAL